MSEQDLNTRVSVLEVSVENMKETLGKMDKNAEEHRNLTFEIKERLDKQNGLIPHMAESVKSLVEVQNKVMEKLNANELEDAKEGEKMKILWAVGGLLGAAVLGYILKSFLG